MTDMEVASEIGVPPLDGPQESVSDWIAFAREVLDVEADAFSASRYDWTERFEQALELLDGCSGKAITVGVGKSGIAARKLAATLTSTGCPAVFLHPSEAMHGDLGIVAPSDVAIVLSNGGESEELLALLPFLQARGVPLIAIVGNLQSTLALRASVILDAGIAREACPLNLAPTTSVVVALALGDALALALQKKRQLGPGDYARNHPGGRLGRRLTLRVRDVAAFGPDNLPLVGPDTGFEDFLCEISARHMGAACVVDAAGKLVGIIAESDLRGALQQHGAAAFALTARAIMNMNPQVVLHPDQLAAEALHLMEDRPRAISVAPVVDSEGRCVAMLRVHDLVRAGL